MSNIEKARAARKALAERSSILLGCNTCGDDAGTIQIWTENPSNIEGWCNCGRKLKRVA